MIEKILKDNLHSFGSELGLGLFLFTLTVSIRAQYILEIGRYKGYSTLALCLALKFLDESWQEPEQHKQRDIDYAEFEGSKPRKVVSVDPASCSEARELLGRHQVEKYGILLETTSNEFKHGCQFDLCFIDGDHTEAQTLKDLQMCYRNLKPGGYIVIHDWFYDGVSPIQRAMKEFMKHFSTDRPDKLLIDTGYMSFVVLRRAGDLNG